MESLCIGGAYRIQPGYEAVAETLVNQLKELRDFYRDGTGLPVVAMPVND
jgi:hypothetical protein